MTTLLKVLTLISFTIALLTYCEVSAPIPNDTHNFRKQKVKLKKGVKFNFKIYVDGQYSIDIVPMDQTPFKDDKIEFSLNPEGFFNSKTYITLEKYELFASGFFNPIVNKRYQVIVEKIPPRLVNKTFEISISESTGTASKNLYFKREFRPYYIIIFQISSILFIILIFILFLLKRKYR